MTSQRCGSADYSVWKASQANLSFELFDCLVHHVLCIVLDVLLLLIAGAGG